MKEKTLLVLGILVFSMLLSTSASMQAMPQVATQSVFRDTVWDRVNDSYVEAKGVTAGNTQAMVAWGSNETQGSLMAIIQHRLPIGIAEIHAPNGTYALPLVSWGYMVIIYDFVGEVGTTIDGRPQLIKQVDLHQANWEVQAQKISQNDTAVEYKLVATTTTPYVNRTDLEAPTLTFTFHLYANYSVVNNTTQKVFVIERNENGEITVAKEDRNVTVPVNRVAVKFKMDYEIDGWTPETNNSKVLIGLRLGLFETHSVLVNRLFKALKRQNNTIAAPPEFTLNKDLDRPIFFRDISNLPKKFGWVPTATVDGNETPVRVRFWNMEKAILRYDLGEGTAPFVGKGLITNGAFIYEAGTHIVHDPDIQVVSEDITESVAQSILSTTKTNKGLLPFAEITLAVSSIFVIATIYRKKIKS